jgi:hypothetical protein
VSRNERTGLLNVRNSVQHERVSLAKIGNGLFVMFIHGSIAPKKVDSEPSKHQVDEQARYPEVQRMQPEKGRNSRLTKHGKVKVNRTDNKHKAGNDHNSHDPSKVGNHY